MSELSQETKKLIYQYQLWKKSLQSKEGISTIHVDEVASKVAAFYEKIRDIVDWKEEHLMRRAAIIRKLKRKFLDLNNLSAEKGIAESLVLELIRGGHYPNDTIDESKIAEVQIIVNKYIFIFKNSSLVKNKRGRLQFYNWILEIAACEIEEILSSSLKERSLIDYMFRLMKEQIKLNQGVLVIKGITEEKINIQIYIAVQRALFKLDSPVISYHLLKYQYPQWNHLSESELNQVTENIYSIWDKMEKELNHPLGDKLYQICERYDTPYLLLGDIISSDPTKIEEKISNPETLEGLIRETYKKRLKTLKLRLTRAAVYATISIFITKIAVALAIEIPVDRYITREFNPLALTINILIPPLLMLFLVATVRLPRKENLDLVVLEIMKIVYKREKKDIYEVKPSLRKNFILNTIVNFFYTLSFIISFGIIIWVLGKLNFPVLSSIIFIVFISLISFAGTRIRQRSKELQITPEKENFLNVIIDFFAIPIIELGKWLISRWQKYNVIAALFNALIDMPFLVFVEFLEQWRYFLKEKKEKIH